MERNNVKKYKSIDELVEEMRLHKLKTFGYVPPPAHLDTVEVTPLPPPPDVSVTFLDKTFMFVHYNSKAILSIGLDIVKFVAPSFIGKTIDLINTQLLPQNQEELMNNKPKFIDTITNIFAVLMAIITIWQPVEVWLGQTTDFSWVGFLTTLCMSVGLYFTGKSGLHLQSNNNLK